MRMIGRTERFCLVGGLLAMAVGLLPKICQAQQSAGPNLMVSGNEMAEREDLSNMDALGDKDEIAAYKNFEKEQTTAKKIQLGNNFLKKYPKSKLTENVDVGMMNAYDAQQDFKDMYLFADNALALQPNDVDALTMVGWTIPHVYTPNDSDADQELDKAEKYSKHALEVLSTIKKPASMKDDQFEAAKSKREFRAHSALGLVYFRREDYDNSAKELALATKGNPVQDATDLYVLGADLQNLNRYGEASEAFKQCSGMAGPLQSQCSQLATQTAGQAAVTKK
jgi:tetratricopeptide (TPR) repeat protein